MTEYNDWLKTQQQKMDGKPKKRKKRKARKRKSNGQTMFLGKDAKQKRTQYDSQQGRCAFCDVKDTAHNRPLVFSTAIKMYLCDTCIARIRNASTGWLNRMRKILDILSEKT